ncbi:MAG TPA: hypothetical protein VMU83_18105 [Hanamia sp.]|nr:hypothetical protein [Hanamia sp.]
MEKENFSGKILGNNGFWYQLSTAEYYKICNDTLQQVLDSAKRAATTTTKLYSIISSESSQSQWIGFSTV